MSCGRTLVGLLSIVNKICLSIVIEDQISSSSPFAHHCSLNNHISTNTTNTTASPHAQSVCVLHLHCPDPLLPASLYDRSGESTGEDVRHLPNPYQTMTMLVPVSPSIMTTTTCRHEHFITQVMSSPMVQHVEQIFRSPPAKA